MYECFFPFFSTLLSSLAVTLLTVGGIECCRREHECQRETWHDGTCYILFSFMFLPLGTIMNSAQMTWKALWHCWGFYMLLLCSCWHRFYTHSLNKALWWPVSRSKPSPVSEVLWREGSSPTGQLCVNERVRKQIEWLRGNVVKMAIHESSLREKGPWEKGEESSKD